VEGSKDNYRVEPNSSIRYIELHRFNVSTVHDLQRLESTFRSEGAGAVILDFRGTNAHDLHVALLLADALMDGGTIGRLRTRTRVQEFHADRERLFRDMHVAILVDENTRGAGEWIVAALQDNDAAVIIGGRTAGSTLVKSFFPLPETNEFLELATGRFERPRSSIDQSPPDGKWSNVEPVIPEFIIDDASVTNGGRRSAQKSARRGPVAGVKQMTDINPDLALSAAIQELKRRIDAASSRTEP
jgi:C-terminal processing protease CtpA/Prc